MRNKCLLTKLKGSVNNNSLPKLGEYIINVVKEANEVKLRINNGFEVSIVGDGLTFYDESDPSTPLTSAKPSQQNMYVFPAGTYKIKILHPYDSNKCNFLLNPTNKYTTYINMSDLKFRRNLNQINLIKCYVEGDTDISNLADAVKDIENTLTLTHTNITGSLSSIGLPIVSPTSANIYIDYTALTGSINDFAERCLAVNGGTGSGSMQISCNGIVTYKNDGVTVTPNNKALVKIVFSGTSYTIQEVV